MAGRETQTERKEGRCERTRYLTLTLSWLFSLYRQEVSPAPFPAHVNAATLPGNRLRGVTRGLATRSDCDRGRDEGRGSPPVCVFACLFIYCIYKGMVCVFR